MTTPPPALARVRKLLALATSSNPHEAALAAARAQALIEAHRLQGWLDAEQEAAADPDPIEDARDEPLETARRIRKWKTVLANALAQANGCVAYTLDAGKMKSIVLVGRRRDREAVRTLWDWLVRRIEWLSATHGAGQDRQWHEAFRIGVVGAVAERLREAVAEAQEALPVRALVRVEPARAAHEQALERFVGEELELKRGRSIRVDLEAWRKGRAASDELELPGDDER